MMLKPPNSSPPQSRVHLQRQAVLAPADEAPLFGMEQLEEVDV